MIMRFIKAFYEFWKDFLIGDCPEVVVGVGVVLAVLLVLLAVTGVSTIEDNLARTVFPENISVLFSVVVPVAIVGVLAFSVTRGMKQ